MDHLNQLFAGPGHMRYFIQPFIALLLGLRDGKLDAAADKAPFLLSVFTSGHHAELLRAATRQIALPLGIAIVLDAVLQQLILGRIRFLAAVITGAVLIALPYGMSRGLSNRAFRHSRRPRHP